MCVWLQRRPRRPGSTWRPSQSWRDSPSRAPGEDPLTSVSPWSCHKGSVLLYEQLGRHSVRMSNSDLFFLQANSVVFNYSMLVLILIVNDGR